MLFSESITTCPMDFAAALKSSTHFSQYSMYSLAADSSAEENQTYLLIMMH